MVVFTWVFILQVIYTHLYKILHRWTHILKDSDIDTLCVIPNLVTRDEFFQRLALRFSENPKIKKMNVMYFYCSTCICFVLTRSFILLGCVRLFCSSDKVLLWTNICKYFKKYLYIIPD